MEFKREKLDNNVVVLFEKRKSPVVSTSIGVRQGSGYERVGKKGISHFIEHLIFKGTDNRTAKEISSEIEKRGGVLNGYTGEEATAFWNKLPKKHFSLGLEILSDCVLNSKMDEEEFNKEKRVIFEEIKMHKDNPHLYVLDKIKSLLYKEPFGLSGIGNFNTLNNINREDLFDYYKKNYNSNKIFLVVVGNTSFKRVRRMGERFPKIESKKKKIKIGRIHKEIEEEREGINQASFCLGVHVPSLREEERYTWDVFDAIFAKGMSSRLFEVIRERRGLAYQVSSYFDRGRDYGYYVIYVGTGKDKVEECKEIILEEWNNLKVSKKDLKDAKEQLIGLRKVGSEESVSVVNKLIEEEIAGKSGDFYKYKEKIKKVKLKEVRDIGIKKFSSISLVPT
jgi:predicted Zn-dependent peptidase